MICRKKPNRMTMLWMTILVWLLACNNNNNIANAFVVFGMNEHSYNANKEWTNHHHHHHYYYYHSKSSLLVRHNLFWFGGKEDKEDKKDANGSGGGDNSNELSAMLEKTSGSMGGTASMMENFKQSQDLGKRTSALVQDLSSSTIEGSAADGKVRVFVDGQQRPIGVDIDPDYISNISSVEDLNEAITLAMQEANSKSMQQMQDKMSNLYTDLGIPTNKAV